MAKDNSQREALIERRLELRKRLNAILADIGGGLSNDYEEQAIELENLDVLREIARVTQQELEKTELELNHLDRGSERQPDQ